MRNTRHRALVRATIALLIGLLVAPLLLGGHRHGAREVAGRPCAACILAHHPPLVSTATADGGPIHVRDRTVEQDERVALARVHRSSHTGRGPPPHSLAGKA